MQQADREEIICIFDTSKGKHFANGLNFGVGDLHPADYVVHLLLSLFLMTALNKIVIIRFQTSNGLKVDP